MTSSPYYINLQNFAKHATTLYFILFLYIFNRKKNCISETPDRDLPRLTPISNGTFSKSHKMEEKSASSMINTEIKNENEMQKAIHTKSTVQAYSAATYSEVQLVQNSCKISDQQEFQKQAELQVLEEREKRKQQQEMGNNVTIEETIFIRPNENIIEIEPDQVSCSV